MATPPRKDSKKRVSAKKPGGPVRTGGKPVSRAGSKPPSRTGAKPAPRTGSRPAPRTAAKPDFRNEVNPAYWPDETPASRPEGKPSSRTGERSANRTGERPATRTGERPANRTGERPATRTGERPANRTGERPATRTGERPASRSGAPAKSGLKPRAKAQPGAKPKTVQSGDRLQKILAAAGVDSRRACEQIILDGRVQVNGVTVTELGTRADARRDEITVDLQPITRENLVYILLNKPKGYVTSVKDDQGRPTVMALIHGVDARVYPVGRLDFNSEGLLLLTNDGALAQRLMAPEFHVPKVYLVKIHRMPKPETLDEFREGFRLDGRRLKPCGIEIAEKADNPWLRVTLIEGKNQQIRKMFAAVGHPVSKLRRIQFGPLDDPAIKPGEWKFLNPQELAALKAL
ncbi:pseudouridine synthase [Geothrix sp. 21YS21S-2]|uniref:pseudouridine synthase n=1 Tax=Geothrix sp. 21YS21S-2 TaxID=3068893 RepID=UPI0027B99893|nr:pseudouridine synthase [Geothrix sp. 21YS21S-2]